MTMVNAQPHDPVAEKIQVILTLIGYGLHVEFSRDHALPGCVAGQQMRNRVTVGHRKSVPVGGAVGDVEPHDRGLVGPMNMGSTGSANQRSTMASPRSSRGPRAPRATASIPMRRPPTT